MHTFETKIQELKCAVLSEVARMTWEDEPQKNLLGSMLLLKRAD